MLSPPKSARTWLVRILSQGSPAKVGTQDAILWTRQGYGRFTRSDEHSPSVAVPGRQSGHALQVRQRAENSGLQAGEPLAVQEVAAGSVDGREIQPNGRDEIEEGEGGRAGRHIKAGTHVWIWIEINRWPGCGLFEH